MKKLLVAVLIVSFGVVGLATSAIAKKKNCDFHQWPMKHCKKPDNLVLTGINFRTGSAQIDPGSYNALDKDVALLQKDPSLRFIIVGHTDSVGGDAANQALSLKRAQSVMEYFKYQGIDPYRMGVMGKGESEPVATEGSAEANYQNRRIEVVFQ